MSWISQLLTPPALASTPAPQDNFWYTNPGRLSSSGERITYDSAMAISTVYACVKVIAEDVAGLPLIMYQRRADGGKDRAPNHPIAELLHDQPNEWQTSFEWREMMMGHVLLRGNAYSRIVPGPRGAVDALVPIHPERVKVERLAGGPLRYTITHADGRQERLLQDEIFHLRGLSNDGIRGISPIDAGLDSLGLTRAVDEHAARSVSQGAHPSGMLKVPGTLTEEQRKQQRENWQDAHSGQNAWKPGLLEGGMDWVQLGMTNEQTELMKIRAHQALEVTRWFRMQPHKVGILDRATFNNIEHQSLEHVIDTVRPWLVRIEQAIRRDLIIATDRFFAEFLMDALLRGDTKTRYEAYASAIMHGWMTRNEARLRDNMNPLEGLDEPLAPLNMIPATQMGKAPSGSAQFRALAIAAAGRIVRKEVVAALRAAEKFGADSDGWHDWVDEFYQAHEVYVAQTMQLETAKAKRYAARQREALHANGVTGIEDWEIDRPRELAAMVLEAA